MFPRIACGSPRDRVLRVVGITQTWGDGGGCLGLEGPQGGKATALVGIRDICIQGHHFSVPLSPTHMHCPLLPLETQARGNRAS